MVTEAVVTEVPSKVDASRMLPAWLALTIFAGVQWVMPWLPLRSPVLALLALVFLITTQVLSTLCYVLAAGRMRLPWQTLLGGLVLAGAGWALLSFGLAPWMEHHAVRHQGTAEMAAGISFYAALNLMLMVAAVHLGLLLAPLVKTPNMMAPVAGIIALLDVWGVLWNGVTAQMMQNAPAIAAKAMTHTPSIGGAVAAPGQFRVSPPAIGAGDFMFLGLLFAALCRLDMNWRPAAVWVALFMTLALLAVARGIDALPGLLFIGAGVALPNFAYFRYTREENFALLYAGLVALAITGLLVVAAHSVLPGPPPTKTEKISASVHTRK